MAPSLVLASASPRRTELLSQLGIAHKVFAVDIDESPHPEELPVDQVVRLAKTKASEAFKRLGDDTAVVLAADTLIELAGQSLGKPTCLEDSVSMLSKLSGKTHLVHTAISACSTLQQRTQLITTRVCFAPLSQAEIIDYWHTGEPQDKAGSYAIQGIGGKFVKTIDGSPSAVIGLPLYETAQLLKQFGVTS